MSRRRLFVCVADLDAENAVKTLLTTRQAALQIRVEFDASRPVDGDLLRFPMRDSGCATKSVEILSPVRESYEHALLIFDHHGSGRESESPEAIETDLEARLERAGWERGAAGVVMIAPELEAWVWAQSPNVSQTLGWGKDHSALRAHLEDQELWQPDAGKPADPKQAMDRALKEKRVPRSSRLYESLAKTVSFKHCEDRAFKKLCEHLRAWFPA